MAATDWWAGWWWWPFAWVFFIFFIVTVMRLVFWRRGWGGPGYRGYWGHPYYGPPAPGHVPAEEILRQRLAKGEIDEAEYERLKRILEK